MTKKYAKEPVMTKSIWRESMRIGVPEFDNERKAMVGVIEQLDMDESHSLQNEFFLIRFRVLEAAVLALYCHEELLMTKFQMPTEEREIHIADHSRILLMLYRVYVDSMEHKTGNALEVYRQVRSALEAHILEIANSLRKYVPTTPK